LNTGTELRHNGVVKYVSQVLPGPLPTLTEPVPPAAGAARPVPVASAAVDHDTPTRERVARAILENGASTAADLARRLSLTPAAVRRHLDNLLADGAVEAREQRSTVHRGRGRPAKVFALTDFGRDEFFQAYDDLAASAMRFLSETGGEAAVAAFARRRVADLEERYRPAVDAVPTKDKAQALAEALTADGYAASVRTAPSGDQICQHHCPVAHVAEQFPQLCEAETEVFARLLGRHVQRLATIAHGDGVCTTNVPGPIAAGTARDASSTGRTHA
jgi:predicted ArsR family transcriptional regulator